VTFVSPRRSLGIVLISGLFAAGCGVGLHSETDKEHATPYLANVSIGPIGVRAVRVVLVSSPSSTTPGPQAYVLASLVNSSGTADTLTSATVGGGAVAAVDSTGAAASVNLTVPPQQLVQLGEPDLGLPGPVLGVGALQKPLQAGTTTTVTFTFQSAGTTTVTAPVLDSTDVGTTASAAPVSASG
jgi:hypothetical protein